MSSSGQPRNIVFILADQLRADVAYHEKYPFVRTANIDRLRRESTTFTQAFCQSPVCGPSRAAITTGRYPQQTGVLNNRCILPPEERTIGHHLGDIGFDCVAFGKTHGQNPGFLVADEPPLVPSLGTSTWGPFRKPPADSRLSDREFEPLVGVFDHPREEHYDFRVAGETARYLETRDTGRPFMLFVGLHGPHPPFLPPREFASLYTSNQIEVPRLSQHDEGKPAFQKRSRRAWMSLSHDEQREMIAAYLAQVSHVDAAAGVILDALDAAGLAEHTVVVFTSDHGDQLGDHGLIGKFHNFYEASIRCPLIVRTPNNPSAGTTCHDLVELVDLYPTLCSLAGVTVPNGLAGRRLRLDPDPSDSDDLRSHVTSFMQEKPAHDIGADPSREYLRGMMIRTDRHKLALYTDDTGELYDLADDPAEDRNRYDDPSLREIRMSLIERLGRESIRLHRAPSLWQTNRFAG